MEFSTILVPYGQIFTDFSLTNLTYKGVPFIQPLSLKISSLVFNCTFLMLFTFLRRGGGMVSANKSKSKLQNDAYKLTCCITPDTRTHNMPSPFFPFPPKKTFLWIKHDRNPIKVCAYADLICAVIYYLQFDCPVYSPPPHPQKN